MKSTSSIPVLSHTSCRPDELRALCRHLQNSVQAHRRYSTHNEKLLRTLEELHQQFLNLTQEYGQLVFDFPGQVLHINGTPMLSLLDPEQHNEFIRLFTRLPVSSLLFTPRSTLRDLSRLFTYLFEEHCPSHYLPSYAKLASQLPSIQLSPSTSAAARSTQQLRNWAAEIKVEEAQAIEVDDHVIEQMVERTPSAQQPSARQRRDTPVEHDPARSVTNTPRPTSYQPQSIPFVAKKESALPATFQREPTVHISSGGPRQPHPAMQTIQVAEMAQAAEMVQPALNTRDTPPSQQEPTLHLVREVPPSAPPTTPDRSASPLAPSTGLEALEAPGQPPDTEELRVPERSKPDPLRELASSEIATPEQLQRMFTQVRDRQSGEVLQRLAQQCAESLPFGLVEFKNISAQTHREAHIAVLLQILELATPRTREEGLRRSLSRLDELPNVETQEFCFSLCRRYAPELLESYIFQSIPVIRYEDLRVRLLQQAVACDTPRLRRLLLQQLQNNALAHDPEQEEWLLRYLHRTQTINALAFLQQRITALHTKLNLRNSAIWMLGAFPNATSLTMLEQLLTSPCPEHIPPKHWQTLRFQAVHTLSRFPAREAKPILERIKHSTSPFFQTYIRSLLNEKVELPEDTTLSSPKNDRQWLLNRLWIAFAVGLFLSLGTLAVLYLSGWLGSWLAP